MGAEAVSLSTQNLSRMIITENYDIILPDYHDMTIKMEPLVKAVYILFCVMRRESFSNVCQIIGKSYMRSIWIFARNRTTTGHIFQKRRFARVSKP